jgi:FkbM family methyltransferase
MRRVVRGILIAGIIAACSLIVAFGYVVWSYRVPPDIAAARASGSLRDISLVFGHRDQAWSVIDGLSALEYEALGRVAAARDEHERMRLVSTEGTLECWRTSAGDFRIPKENALDLADMIAEIERYPAVHKDEVVLDCGANMGVFTRRALQAGAARVVAIEPAPLNVECLRRTFAAEIKEGRVSISPKALWDTHGGQMALRLGNVSSTNSLVLNAGAAEVLVPLTTLDQVAADFGLARVNVIKMDIEGAEQHALKGAANLLSVHRPRLYVAAYHMMDDTAAIPQIVRSARGDYSLKTAGSCIKMHGRINPETFVFE